MMGRGPPHDRIAAAIVEGRYRSEPVSSDVFRVPGMISREEREVLSFLAARAWTAHTAIVDAGCGLGASTRALMDGLTRNRDLGGNPRPIIHAYDLFRADPYMLQTVLANSRMQPGDCFESRFLENLRVDPSLVAVHAGDVRANEWGAEPISLLFLDIIWSWDINSFVMRNFYKNLSSDGAFVVHQDYVYAWYPWIPITMEYLADHFELVDYVPLATVVFRYVKPFDENVLGIDLLRELSPDSLLSLMARAMERFSGESRGILECSRAHLLRYFGRKGEARASLLAVGEDYAEFEAPVRFAREILAHIDSGAEPRVV